MPKKTVSSARARRKRPASSSTRSRPRKKTRTRKKNPLNSNAQQLKRSVRRAFYDFYVISVIFLILLLLSSAFLFYQWKDYQMVAYGKQIQFLNADILKLRSEVSHNQARVNSEYQKYYRIARVAKEKLGLEPSAQEPIFFKVDREKLTYYVQKDREEQ